LLKQYSLQTSDIAFLSGKDFHVKLSWANLKNNGSYCSTAENLSFLGLTGSKKEVN